MNRREHLEEKIALMLEEVHTVLAKGFEAEVQRTLDDWHKRYPRHTFEACEGNGTLSFSCQPPLTGSKHIGGDFGYVSGYVVRGAIKTLMDEAEDLNDWYISLDFKCGATFESGNVIRSK